MTSDIQNQNTPTLGELFAGIAGFGLAAERAGVETLWQCEIDAFCLKVLEKRFPNAVRYTNVCELNGAEIAPVDIITAGSPCQDLSVAGGRAGLDGERSGLFLEFIRIVREMREATNGEYPKFIIWENVPGAYTSNRGEDFRRVLREVVELGARDVAWRTLNAEFFGVPQRRRRIVLVADFGGERAAEVLFESEGLCGDPAPSQQAGSETPGSTGDGADAGSLLDGPECWPGGRRLPRVVAIDNPSMFRPDGSHRGGVHTTHPTLNATVGPTILVDESGETVPPYGEVAHCVTTAHHRYDPTTENLVVVANPLQGQLDADISRAITTKMEHNNPSQETFVIAPMDTASTLTASAGHHGHSSPRGDGTDNLVIEAPAGYRACWEDHGNGKNCRMPVLHDVRESIIESIVASQQLSSVPMTREDAEAALDRALNRPLADIGVPVYETAATLTSGGHPNSNAPGRRKEDDKNLVVVPGRAEVVQAWLSSSYKTYDNAGTHGKGPSDHLVVEGEAIAFQERGREGGRNLEYQINLAYCLTSPHGGGRRHEMNIAFGHPIPGVRRLMPVEAERLQGFPDGWTCLENHPQPCDCKDTARYRALGNAVCVSVAEWVFPRLVTLL